MKAQLDDEQWAKLLHHIAVEVFTLQKAGRDVLEVCNARSSTTSSDLIAGTTITSAAGLPVVESWDADEEIALLDSILQGTDETLVPSQESLENELRQATSSDIQLTYPGRKTQWTRVQLREPKVKLAVR